MINFVASTVAGSRQVAPDDLDSAFAATLQTAGGTMTGPLLLAADPKAPDEAATMRYVDGKLSSGGGTPGTPAPTGGTGQSLSVKANGAVGDGTTDDTAAIQSCIDKQFAAGGGQVFFPIGNYSHTGLTLRHGVMLMGATPAGFNGIGPDLPGSQLTLRPASNRSSVFIPLKQNPTATYPGNLYATSNCGMYWMRIDGNKQHQAGTSHGVELEMSAYLLYVTGNTILGNAVITAVSSTASMEIGALISGPGVPSGAYVAALTATAITMSAPATATGAGVTILVNNQAVDSHDSAVNFDHCYFGNCLSDGQRINLGWRSVLNNNVTSKDNGGNGFSCLTSDNRYSSCIALVNGGSGFYVGSVSNRFVSCDSSVNAQNGFRFAETVSGTGGNTVMACTADENQQEGIFVENLCPGISIIGGLINDNGTSSASFADLYDANGANGVTLVGVTFGLPGKVNPNPVYNIYCAGTIEVTGCTFVPGSSRNGPFQDAVKVRFSSPGKSAWINAAGTMLFGPGGGDVNFLRFAAGIVGTSQKLVATGGIGVGNAVPATTLGAMISKFEVFNDAGVSLGFVPIYGTGSAVGTGAIA